MTSSGEYTVSETARAAGISRQAYYKWLNRRLSL
ncbi:helix-turn-helix domain-containing protein, partial [Limosilactobacillus fermentum]